MTNAEREARTLSFSNEGLDRGTVEEMFEPWDLTIKNWEAEGLQTDFNRRLAVPEIPTEIGYVSADREVLPVDRYFHTMLAEPIFELEQQFGFDPLKRMAFRLPFLSYEAKVLEDTDEYFIRFDRDGCTRKYRKDSEIVYMLEPVVRDEESWEQHKRHTLEAMDRYLTDEAMEARYGQFREGCARGDFAIRFRLQGFFWAPRDFMGVEEHMMAYYDYPEMLHEINEFQIEMYQKYMDKILKIVTPNVVFFEEDLSGKNGPMLSPNTFDEFLAPCYRAMVPFLKERGVKYVFVDTDGDFTLLIPNFTAAGIDGFLPVDVNAGVDIVDVRRRFPNVRFIGGYNKLAIVDGPEAIDAEFKRLEPVIRQGGYIPCIDHQAAPATSLANYRYYVRRLKEVMREWRGARA